MSVVGTSRRAAKSVPSPLSGEADIAQCFDGADGRRSRVARRETAARHRAVAVLVVHNAAQNPWSPPEIIAKAFGLTPRKVTVLFALADAPGVAEVAERLGLSEATIRTHLRALFAKLPRFRRHRMAK